MMMPGAVTPRPLTRLHIRRVAPTPVGRVWTYKPEELQVAVLRNAGGSVASALSWDAIAVAAVPCTAVSICAAVVMSAAAPVMATVDQSAASGWVPKEFV